MRYKLLPHFYVFSVIGIVIMVKPANSGGIFDWMSPNKWFNNRDYDRDYHRGHGYGYPGYGYPNYAYPGYAYPSWGYPGLSYPGWGYPAYTYPVQPQQNNSNTPAPPPPTPQ